MISKGGVSAFGDRMSRDVEKRNASWHVAVVKAEDGESLHLGPGRGTQSSK